MSVEEVRNGWNGRRSRSRDPIQGTIVDTLEEITAIEWERKPAREVP